MHFRVSGSNPQRRLVFGNSLRQPAGHANQSVRQVVVRFRAAGLNPHGFLVFGNGLGQPARDARQCVSQVVVGIGTIRIDPRLPVFTMASASGPVCSNSWPDYSAPVR